MTVTVDIPVPQPDLENLIGHVHAWAVAVGVDRSWYQRRDERGEWQDVLRLTAPRQEGAA